MVNEINMNGEDVDIEKLVPLKERDINLRKHRGYKKILSSISAIGLIEPLCVYKENSDYIIIALVPGSLSVFLITNHRKAGIRCYSQ